MDRCTVGCEIFSSAAICRWVIPLAASSKARLSRSAGTSENLGKIFARGPTKASARSLEIGDSYLHLDFLVVLELVDMGSSWGRGESFQCSVFRLNTEHSKMS